MRNTAKLYADGRGIFCSIKPPPPEAIDAVITYNRDAVGALELLKATAKRTGDIVVFRKHQLVRGDHQSLPRKLSRPDITKYRHRSFRGGLNIFLQIKNRRATRRFRFRNLLFPKPTKNPANFRAQTALFRSAAIVRRCDFQIPQHQTDRRGPFRTADLFGHAGKFWITANASR